MTPAECVAEDGLVGHQREERPLVLRARCPSIEECQDKEGKVGGLVSRGRRDGLRSFPGRGNQERGQHLKYK